MLFLYSKRLHEQKNITKVNSVTNTSSIQQTHMFHGCTIQINKTLSLENFRRRGATRRFYLHVVNIEIIETVSQTRCFVM